MADAQDSDSDISYNPEDDCDVSDSDESLESDNDGYDSDDSLMSLEDGCFFYMPWAILREQKRARRLPQGYVWKVSKNFIYFRRIHYSIYIYAYVYIYVCATIFVDIRLCNIYLYK